MRDLDLFQNGHDPFGNKIKVMRKSYLDPNIGYAPFPLIHGYGGIGYHGHDITGGMIGSGPKLKIPKLPTDEYIANITKLAKQKIRPKEESSVFDKKAFDTKYYHFKIPNLQSIKDFKYKNGEYRQTPFIREQLQRLIDERTENKDKTKQKKEAVKLKNTVGPSELVSLEDISHLDEYQIQDIIPKIVNYYTSKEKQHTDLRSYLDKEDREIYDSLIDLSSNKLINLLSKKHEHAGRPEEIAKELFVSPLSDGATDSEKELYKLNESIINFYNSIRNEVIDKSQVIEILESGINDRKTKVFNYDLPLRVKFISQTKKLGYGTAMEEVFVTDPLYISVLRKISKDESDIVSNDKDIKLNKYKTVLNHETVFFSKVCIVDLKSLYTLYELKNYGLKTKEGGPLSIKDDIVLARTKFMGYTVNDKIDETKTHNAMIPYYIHIGGVLKVYDIWIIPPPYKNKAGVWTYDDPFWLYDDNTPKDYYFIINLVEGLYYYNVLKDKDVKTILVPVEDKDGVTINGKKYQLELFDGINSFPTKTGDEITVDKNIGFPINKNNIIRVEV